MKVIQSGVDGDQQRRGIPNLVKPYEFRARAYIEKGESGLTIADCQKALAVYPDYGEVKRLM